MLGWGNTQGQRIATLKASNGTAEVQLPTAGMYIVRSNNGSEKVVVR